MGKLIVKIKYYILRLTGNLYTKGYLSKNVALKGRLNVGDHTYGRPRIYTWGEDSRLDIGNFCSIANNVKILLGGNHRHDWITTYPFPGMGSRWTEAVKIKEYRTSKGDVKIGNDVWIGDGVTILSGVTIGDGAVIGANATVAKDVKPYRIVVGNPAKTIGQRFSDEEIEALLNLKWWNWDDEKINSNLNILCSRDIDKILKQK